jgi:hypothetical protein
MKTFSGGAGVRRALWISLLVLCGMRAETAETALDQSRERGTKEMAAWAGKRKSRIGGPERASYAAF